MATQSAYLTGIIRNYQSRYPQEDPKKNINGYLNICPLEFKPIFIELDHDEFRSSYSDEGWLFRKVTALAPAVWSVAAKSIYHLAKTLLFFKASTDAKTYVTAQLFCVARDFQEAFGWLMSLYSDEWGQYHIQQSELYKSYYDAKSKYSDFSDDWVLLT